MTAILFLSIIAIFFLLAVLSSLGKKDNYSDIYEENKRLSRLI